MPSSKLHRRTLRLLKEYLGCPIKEEVNVKKLFPDYPANNHHFDLVIPSYNLIVECHGIQHRTMKTFGEKDVGKAIEKFHQGRGRDKQKEEAVWENEWGYIVVWYDELPKDDTEAKEILKTKIIEAIKGIEYE